MRKKSAAHIRREQMGFILCYLRVNGSTYANDQAFHDAFYDAFGGLRVEKSAGRRVMKAMSLLMTMARKGQLDRQYIPHGRGHGYSYRLSARSLIEAKS